MKTRHFIFLAFFFLFAGNISAQDDDLSKMTEAQRREYLSKLSKEEKKKLYQRYQENVMIDKLDLPQNQQEEFRNLYKEYQQSQEEIVRRFKSGKFNDMSNEQARNELDNSFELGQQLMDNRKRYSEKFQKIMPPQQVLRMFENEKMMRDKVMERRNESQGRDNSRGNGESMRTRSTEPSQRMSTPSQRTNPQSRSGSPSSSMRGGGSPRMNSGGTRR